jgi:DNA-binding transcriptional regulator PaaX
MDVGRDISRGEQVEQELTAMIMRRHDRRVFEEGERPALEAWQESERRYEARSREENRLAWCGYFGRLAACLRTRAEEYDRRVETLMEDQPKGDTA